MSERPEWMPSDEEISAATYADDKEHESGQPNAEALIHRTGLRAQIAVLEEIWEEMPSEDFEEDEPLYRKDMVFLKIDALRKELKQ